MKSRLNFIKTTVVGGVVFIIPGVIVVAVLAKLIGVLKTIAKGLSSFFGIQTVLGGLALDILAFTLAVFFCFSAGLLAKRASLKRVREQLDRFLLNNIPGYTFIKGYADTLRQTEELSATFLPVIVQFNDCVRIAFETDRRSNGRVAIYLPGAPNPWSGSLVFVPNERVKPLAISLAQAVRNIGALGKGFIDIADLDPKIETAQRS